jgi:hypothetical protein
LGSLLFTLVFGVAATIFLSYLVAKHFRYSVRVVTQRQSEVHGLSRQTRRDMLVGAMAAIPAAILGVVLGVVLGGK